MCPMSCVHERYVHAWASASWEVTGTRATIEKPASAQSGSFLQ
jgi:hypothetical protein